MAGGVARCRCEIVSSTTRQDVKLASIVASFSKFRFCIDFRSFFFYGTSEPQQVWFYHCNNIVFAKSPFREHVNLFINFSIILAPLSDDFAIIC